MFMRKLFPSGFKPMLVMLVALVISPNLGHAEGALAIGHPPDIAKQGYAFGTSWNYATKDEAISNALERCRRTKSDVPRSLCKVVRVFKNECAVVALDPKNGTPGAGWAVEATLKKAEAEALEECRATAGSSRRGFCEVSSKGGCDTNK
jgi:hypothetical protein